jgi:hypothetical protein
LYWKVLGKASREMKYNGEKKRKKEQASKD